MKTNVFAKYLSFFTVLMISLLFVTSCDDDDPVPPQFGFVTLIEMGNPQNQTNNDQIQVAPNKGVVISVSLEPGDARLQSYKISRSATNRNDTSIELSGNNIVNRKDTIKSSAVEETEGVTLTVTDRDGELSTRTVDIVTQDPVGDPVQQDTAVLLGSFNSSNTGSFYSVAQQKVFTVSETSGQPNEQEKIDVVYFNGSTNGQTIAAPSNVQFFGTGSNQIDSYDVHNWTNRNATTFKMTNLSPSDFNGFTGSNEVENAYDNASGSEVDNIKQLSKDDVIAFQTDDDDKKGVLHVQEFEVGGPDGDRITLNIKVESN